MADVSPLQPYTLSLSYKAHSGGTDNFNLLGNENIALGSTVCNFTYVGWLNLWMSKEFNLKGKIRSDLASAGFRIDSTNYTSAIENRDKGDFLCILAEKAGPFPKEDMEKVLRIFVANGIMPESDIARVKGTLLPDEVKEYLVKADPTQDKCESAQLSLSRPAAMVRLSVKDRETTDFLYQQIVANEPDAASIQKQDCQILIPCETASMAKRKFDAIKTLMKQTSHDITGMHAF